MKKLLSVAAVIVVTATAPLVFGEQKTHAGVGTVRSVDRTKGEVTLTHGQISSLNWAGMTMDFQVRESRLFDCLQPDKQVVFEFVADGHRYVVTSVIPLADQGVSC